MDNVESVYRAWRVGIRRVWGLPSNAHSALLPLVCCRLPLYDKLMKHMTRELLLNILVPAIGQKVPVGRLFHSLSVTIRLARFLVLSNL